MIQGTGSDAGKSTLVAGLCRVLVRRGFVVRPFKPQNMSTNAAVCPAGGEIGRAQALQARAARVTPNVDMNPVLLKPDSDTGAQLIVRGEVAGRAVAGAYQRDKGKLLAIVLESYRRLAAEADYMVVEGAGSASEINLRAGDIANMGFAEAADLPVVLAGDIDRGGLIAAIVGTMAVVSPSEAARIKGYIVNKFRGDERLFQGGIDEIRARTGLPCFGILPWHAPVRGLPSEDTVILDDARAPATRPIRIAVPLLPRIANFDDFDPLRAEPDVALELVPPGKALPGDADLVILPGSKATIADLAALRAQGWDVDLAAHVRRGGKVLGICAGFQMLGHGVDDPEGLDGTTGRVEGLGLLAIDTVMTGDKALREVTGRDHATGQTIRGYEMHLGRSSGADLARPMLDLAGRPDGAVSADGRITGCYVHGLFAADDFRHAFLASLKPGRALSGLAYEALVEKTLDGLADLIEARLDVDALIGVASSGADFR
ncbi:MAG: cobyric acid synthase [Alphaproteobacteria bacterium]|nr:cobyric acid synthase [Alphaproteobacteria bacterium]